ncbi:hypothetical protein [Dongia sp.]|uniref:hypothetical protein n=1 Tax=Dongia sp. TaxID=1977262 RepID=UPI0035B3F23A
MPLLVKFMLRHALIGHAMAGIFVAAFFALDVGGLATLVGSSNFGILAVALLTFFTGLTFAGLQMGMAIMSLKGEPEEDEAPRGPDGEIDSWQAQPVPAIARKQR